MMSSIRQCLGPYFSPRVFSMLVLGFPYGMMYFLAIPTLQTWLKELGLSNTLIGLFAWVCLPYVLKFLWAPLVGYIKIPILGRYLGHRRSWLVMAHLFLMFFLVLLGLSNPLENLYYTAFLALALTFFAGIQDIVVDAYRIEILDKQQAGPGIGMLITGYRLGSVTANAGALYLAEHYGWHLSYTVMATLVVMGVIAALMNPEPKVPLRQEGKFLQAYILPPLKDFFGRQGWGYIALFIVLFRFPDAMINNMANVFYLETGFSKTEIADVTKMFGFFPTLFGGLIGGALAVRMRLFNALFFSGGCHALSHILLVMQAILGYEKEFLYVVIFFENITSGVTTAVFLVYLSRLCNLKYVATQFAFFTSLWSSSSFLAAGSGFLVEKCFHGDWITFFTMAFLLSLPGLVLIGRIRHYPLGNAGAYLSGGN